MDDTLLEDYSSPASSCAISVTHGCDQTISFFYPSPSYDALSQILTSFFSPLAPRTFLHSLIDFPKKFLQQSQGHFVSFLASAPA